MKQKICVITGSRAEFGLLRPLLMRMKSDKRYELQLLVTGAHWSTTYGNTYKEILRDDFKINARIPLNVEGNSALRVTSATGAAVKGIGKALKKLNPDLVIVLGDRFEILAAATASHLLSVPVAHIHGGELTAGSLDDAMRHAITKLSVLHFTSTSVYRKRVIQMGEEPQRVFSVGALGVENILARKFLKKAELEEWLGIKINKPLAVVTFHPATHEKINTASQVKSLLAAIDRMPDLQYIITYPNADEGGRMIIRNIEKFAARCQNVHIYKNLGSLNYLSLLKFADVVIGNSSSGIIEVPSFGIPTVNIGDRQKLREAAKSVIHSEAKEDDIYRAIQKALRPSFKAFCKKVVNPYGDGHASRKILSVLHRYKKLRTIEKKFYDL